MKTRLKNIANVVMGQSLEEKGIFDIETEESFEFHQGNKLFENKNNIGKSKVFGLAGKLAHAGDVLFSVRAPVGDIAILNRSIIIGRGLAAIRASKNIDRNYLYYMLNTSIDKLKEEQTGTTFDSITTADLRNLIVEDMPKYKQTAIANYLDIETSKIDLKISILEQTFEKLEEYKQSVIFETVTKGLDHNIPMKNSEIDSIGEIPAHWEILRLKDSSIIKKGESFDEKLASIDGIYPYINGGINPSDWSNHFNTKENTIAVSEGGASAGYTQFMTKKYWAGSHCYKIQSKNKKSDNKYLFYVLKGFEKYLMIEKTGSAMPNLQKTKFINYLVSFVKNIEEQNKIIDYLDFFTSKVDKKKEIIKKQIELLKEYKQTIIYEAVTGKIKIGELYA